MFDVGFPELLLISIVALLVIGPDRLPETVRNIALWVGRFKRSFANIRQEIEKEIGADEIRQQLHNETIMADIERSKAAFNEFQDEVQDTVDQTIGGLKESTENLKQVDEPKQGNG